MDQKNQVIIRGAQASDGEALNKLFNEIYEKQRSVEYWNWMFTENPAGDWEEVYSVAEVKNCIVGQYPTQTRRWIYKGRMIRTVLVMDNLVHPEYRKGYSLQKLLYEYAAKQTKRKANIAFGYGFPNRVAHRVGKSLLGYRDVLEVPELLVSLSLRAGIARRAPWLPEIMLAVVDWLSRKLILVHLLWKKIRNSNEYEVRELTNFGPEFDDLWQRAKPNSALCAIRDQTFLNWRFGRDDIKFYWKLAAYDNKGKLWGYVIGRNIQEGSITYGYIVDYLADHAAVLKVLVTELMLRLAQDGADYGLTMSVPGTKEFLALKAAGLKLKSGFDGRKLVVHEMNEHIPINELTDKSAWYVTFGDSDMV